MARVMPLFAYSRNPLDLLLTRSLDAPQWFRRHGVPLTRRFLRALPRHADVRRADLEVTERATRDELGQYAWTQAKLRLELRDHRQFRVDGSGHASTPDMARVIAFAELLERISLELNLAAISHAGRLVQPAVDSSSNGFCFHSSAARVVKGALCELLERDAFLSHWYAGRAMPGANVGGLHPLHRLATRLDAAGWRLREHAWKHDKVDAACVYVSATRRHPAREQWNFFLGSGVAPTYREAIAKAASEMLRMFRMWHAAYDRVDQRARISARSLTNVLSRLLVFQRPAYILEFERMTSARPNGAVHRLTPRSDRAFVVEALRVLGDVKIVAMPVPVVLHPHVFCIKAVSDQLQNLDWRVPPRFNAARIESAFGTQPRRFNHFSHPLA